MHVPLSWLRTVVALPEHVGGRDVAAALVRVGLEVEAVEEVGADLVGPLVVGRVAAFEEETHSNGKTVRWCEVEVGDVGSDPGGHPGGPRGGLRGIVCGARNFAAGDAVVVALPGAVLPGGFAISARKTYGHVSDGMICSPRELGIGTDHSGILVLPPGSPVGTDAVPLLRLRDEILDIAVKPDRAYCLSVRGVGREAATALGLAFHDPAALSPPVADGSAYPVRVEDPAGCDRFVARRLTGLDPTARSPVELQRRLLLAGMRPVSLAVDVTNAVLLELGQPLHAYDAACLAGPIVVRRAHGGEQLETLDGQRRTLDPDDLVIADDRGPIGIAGVLGGATTEVSATTTDVVIEAAHFEPGAVARAARRHKVPSEASRRFERGVDPDLPAVAAEAAARLLAQLAGATPGGTTELDTRPTRPTITLSAALPGRLAGRRYDAATVRRRLAEVGCALEGPDDALVVRPPSWRLDLEQPVDLVEEVVRLEGYDTIPSVLPPVPAGRGLTAGQRLRRRVARSLAGAGYVEVPAYPFTAPDAIEALGLDADDPRRRAVRLTNPLSREEPLLPTTLLPGLLTVVRRNVGRGQGDLSLFAVGPVFRARPGAPPAPRLPVDHPPSAADLAALEAALPEQPRHVAVALCGDRDPAGWWGPGRPAVWADAVEAARVIARETGARLAVRPADLAPWHPGRCAALVVGGAAVGHAGELHPRVIGAFELPARTCVMELDLDAVLASAVDVVPAPAVSAYPVATQDVALVVSRDVPAAAVEEALRTGAGPLLESLRLFDLYTGEQLGAGERSLAYALRFRAPDRTLTAEEVTAARDAAVAEAARRTGAMLRSGR